MYEYCDLCVQNQKRAWKKAEGEFATIQLHLISTIKY